jgi:predicted membrane channel-forming protein YqfA (hemolysin III family)
MSKAVRSFWLGLMCSFIAGAFITIRVSFSEDVVINCVTALLACIFTATTVYCMAISAIYTVRALEEEAETAKD